MKRKYSSRTRRFRKRPRFGRTRSRRFSRGYGSTAQWGKPFNNGFRSRKLRGRAWRGQLWRETQTKTHYRSVAGQTSAGVTAGTVILKSMGLTRLMDNAVGPFYTVAGGATPVDAGVAVGTIRGDVILRGGISRLTLVNQDLDDAVRAEVWVVQSTEQPISLAAYLSPNTVPTDWDPSCIPDFQRFGRILYKREVLLLPQAQPFVVNWRHRPRKIDQAAYVAGKDIYWLTAIGKVSDTLGLSTPAAVRETATFNVSWTADFTT